MPPSVVALTDTLLEQLSTTVVATLDTYAAQCAAAGQPQPLDALLQRALEALLLGWQRHTCQDGRDAQRLAQTFARLAQETAHTLTAQLLAAGTGPRLG